MSHYTHLLKLKSFITSLSKIKLNTKTGLNSLITR